MRNYDKKIVEWHEQIDKDVSLEDNYFFNLLDTYCEIVKEEHPDAEIDITIEHNPDISKDKVVFEDGTEDKVYMHNVNYMMRAASILRSRERKQHVAKIGIVVQGGLIEKIVSNDKKLNNCQAIILDKDIESTDMERIVETPEGEASVSSHSIEKDNIDIQWMLNDIIFEDDSKHVVDMHEK